MLLWCQQQDESCLASVKDELTKNGIEQYLRCQSPVSFARWLFSQRRGAVRPWSVLLVHWRDAKPCSSAVATVRSGCLQHLAHLPDDAQRPNLPALTLSRGQVKASALQPVNSAVGAMIIIVSQGKQERRAQFWVSSIQAAANNAMVGSAHNLGTCSEHQWANGFKFFIANDPRSFTASLHQCQQLIDVSPPKDYLSSTDHRWAQLVDLKHALKSQGAFKPGLMMKHMPYTTERAISCNRNNDAENENPIDICNVDINSRMSQLSEHSPWLLGTEQTTLGLRNNVLANEPMISLCPDPEVIPWPVFPGIWHV